MHSRGPVNLFPQSVDVGVYRVFVAVMSVSPDHVKQVFATEHTAGVTGKVVQQVKFARREFNRLAGDVDGAAYRINTESVDFYLLGQGVRP